MRVSRERSVQHGFLSYAVPRREGEHGRDLDQTDLQSVGRANLHAVGRSAASASRARRHMRAGKTYDKAMLPFSAKEMAFMNSVVFGTSANRMTPSSFSEMPEPLRTTSTTSTKISAMTAYRTVQASSTVALLARLQFGAS